MKKSISLYVTIEPLLKLRQDGVNVDRMVDEFLHFQAFGQQSKEARMGGPKAEPLPKPESKPPIKLDKVQRRLIEEIREEATKAHRYKQGRSHCDI